jgi:hypothetical protein
MLGQSVQQIRNNGIRFRAARQLGAENPAAITRASPLAAALIVSGH